MISREQIEESRRLAKLTADKYISRAGKETAAPRPDAEKARIEIARAVRIVQKALATGEKTADRIARGEFAVIMDALRKYYATL